MIEQVKGTRNLFGAESEKYIHIFNACLLYTSDAADE